MICTRCGTEFNSGVFCPKCGMKNERENVETEQKEGRKMFCRNCGKELDDNVIFCPDCGTKKTEIPKMEAEALNMETENKKSGRNIIFRIWDSRLFTRAAIKFGNLLEILEGIIMIAISRFFSKEDGGTFLGILFLLCGICGLISGVVPLIFSKKNSEEKELSESDIKKKKRNFCIGILVIPIILVIFINSGGGMYYVVQSISFDEMGPETIGELVEENIESPEWSKEKLSSTSQLVYVEGYCPAYGEKLKVEFYCKELDDDSLEVSLNKIYLLGSGEEFNAAEMIVVWSSFYPQK